MENDPHGVPERENIIPYKIAKDGNEAQPADDNDVKAYEAGYREGQNVAT